MPQHLQKRLRKILAVRAVLLFSLVVLSVLFSSILVKKVLVKTAMESEVAFFWENYEKDSNFPAPHTWNLKGSFHYSIEALCDEMYAYCNLEEGFNQITRNKGYAVIHKSERNGKILLLLFSGQNMSNITLLFGVLPITIFLFAISLLAWFIYRKAKKELSPLTWLNNKFENLSVDDSHLLEFDAADVPDDSDYEAINLVNSLSDYIERIQKFVEREKSFTRDVSHELRTPLTIISMGVQVMEGGKHLQDSDIKTLARIKLATKEMLSLVEAFLNLAREVDDDLEETEVSIGEIVEYQINEAKRLLEGKNVTIGIVSEQDFIVEASSKVVEVLIGNLIQNSCKYTKEGYILVEVDKGKVTVKDTGIGMDEEQLDQVYKPFFRGDARSTSTEGHGVGLAIVNRISQRFGWPIHIESELAVGTTVTIDFKAKP